ncbi:MAG: hypothetical protein WC346_01410 [Methanogenium sp.]|jgi:hypothetical protein
MVFSDSSLSQGIVQDIDSWLNTDDTSYPIAQKVRDVNAWYDRVISIIVSCDGRWQFDDSNNTDLPIATTSLVSGQQDYTLDGSDHFEVTRMEVLDKNGSYYLLDPIDEHDVTNQALTEFYKTPGRPVKYDKRGSSIVLYPAPSSSHVTTTKGLKLYFQRGASHFAADDTTKTPGFNPLFHRILSLGPALDYASKNELTTKIKIIQPRLDRLEAALIDSYSNRSRDESVSLRLHKNDYGARSIGSDFASSDRVAFY